MGGDCAEGHEFIEGRVDTAGFEVPVEDTPDRDGADDESGEAMECGFGQHRLRAFRARCRVGRLLCGDRIDLWLRRWLRRWFRRLAKRLGLTPAREPVQFGSALFDFGEGGYMGAIRGACLQHGSTIPFLRSGRAGNERREPELLS